VIAILIAVLDPWMRVAANSGRYLLHGLLTAALLVTTIACFRGGYLAIIATQHEVLWPVLLSAASVMIAGMFVRPFDAADVWNYVNAGWLQLHYHLSPYGHRVLEVPGCAADPMFNLWVADYVFPYGPLFGLYAELLCRLSRGNVAVAVGLFKFGNALAAIAIGAAASAVASHRHTERRDALLYLLLCHPLIAIQFIGQGHNDLLASLWIVLAIYFAARERWVLVLPALMIGVMVKVLPGLALPFAFVYIVRRRGWHVALAGSAAAIAVGVIAMIPYRADSSIAVLRATVGEQAFTSYRTLASGAAYVVESASQLFPSIRPRHPGRIYQATAALAMLAYVAFYVQQFVLFWRKQEPILEDLTASITVLLLVFLCLARTKYDAWYVGMFLPVALMLGWRNWLCQAAVALGFGGLLEPALDLYGPPVIDFALEVAIPVGWAVSRQLDNVQVTLTGAPKRPKVTA
jgi:hypothetical protein